MRESCVIFSAFISAFGKCFIICFKKCSSPAISVMYVGLNRIVGFHR